MALAVPLLRAPSFSALIQQHETNRLDEHLLVSMRVILQNVTKETEINRVRMTVQFGEEPPKSFLGDYDGTDQRFVLCNVEQELFMRLSDLAQKRYCNCAIYQFELMGIIKAFLSDKPLPEFPIELGTTSFGLKRPTPVGIFFDRLRSPFYIALLWWKYRHIRRENRSSGSSTCPFQAGEKYRVRRNYSFLNHKLIAGELVEFCSFAYDAKGGVKRYWFKNMDNGEINVWHVFDEEKKLDWRDYFEVLPLSASV